MRHRRHTLARTSSRDRGRQAGCNSANSSRSLLHGVISLESHAWLLPFTVSLLLLLLPLRRTTISSSRKVEQLHHTQDLGLITASFRSRPLLSPYPVQAHGKHSYSATHRRDSPVQRSNGRFLFQHVNWRPNQQTVALSQPLSDSRRSLRYFV
jgi:hypothetical protein